MRFERSWFRLDAWLSIGSMAFVVAILLSSIPAATDGVGLLIGAGVVLGLVAFLMPVAIGSIRVVRAADPTLTFGEDLTLSHPYFRRPLSIGSESVHSVWVGAINPPRRLKFMERFTRRPDVPVGRHTVDLTGRGFWEDAFQLLVVFDPPLIVDRANLASTRQIRYTVRLPRTGEVRGLFGSFRHATDASELVARAGLTDEAIPADVLAWLAG